MSRVENYCFISDEVWKNVKLSMPKYNTEFRMNVSGMDFKALAAYLRLVAECIECGVEGKTQAVFDGEVPFIRAEINHNNKWPWEDGYEEGLNKRSLLGSVVYTEDKSYVSIDSCIKELTDDERTIPEYMTRKCYVTTTKNGQKIRYEYADSEDE